MDEKAAHLACSSTRVRVPTQMSVGWDRWLYSRARDGEVVQSLGAPNSRSHESPVQFLRCLHLSRYSQRHATRNIPSTGI